MTVLFVGLVQVNMVLPAGALFSVASDTPCRSFSSLYGRVFLGPAGLEYTLGICDAV